MKKCISYGDDFHYAATRLNGTLVRTKDNSKVLYIKDVGEDGRVLASDMSTGDHLEESLDNIDPTPPRLGYFNHDKHSIYVTRVPVRYYKQGITSNNVNSKNYVDITRPEFAQSILGLYPSPIKCLESIVCGIAESRAYSRNFCFLGWGKEKIRLLFRDRPVGFVNWNDNLDINYHLDDEYSFLDAMLEESFNA